MSTANTYDPVSTGTSIELDFLRRSNTLSSTGTRGARFLRDRLRRRKLYPIPSDESGGSPCDHETPTEGVSLPTLSDVLAAFRVAPEMLVQFPEEYTGYDSLKPYLANPAEEDRLVETEARRLVDVIWNQSTPLLLKGCQRLGTGDAVGYIALRTVAEVLLFMKAICDTDKAGFDLLHTPGAITDQAFRAMLRPFHSVAQSSSYIDSYLRLTREPGGSERVWASPGELAEDAAAILDLITGCIAKHLAQVAHGKHWLPPQLYVLARYSAKVKLLLRDPNGSAAVALRNAESCLAKRRGPAGTAGNQVPHKDAVYQLLDAAPPELESQMFYRPGYWYRKRQLMARHYSVYVVEGVLQHLYTRPFMSELSPSEYDICMAVVQTGIQDFQTLLYQGRDLTFSSTSDADELNFTHPAFRMLDAVASHLVQERNRRPPAARACASGPENKTRLEWEYSGMRGSLRGSSKALRNTLELVNMSDIIAVLVPLTLASPQVGDAIKAAIQLFKYSFGMYDVTPFPERPFHGFARLYTTDFSAAFEKRLPDDVSLLADAIDAGLFRSTSLLNASVAGGAGASKARENCAEGDSVVDQQTEQSQRKRDRMLADAQALMDTWVYTETAVVVPCALYVCSCVGVVAVLVGGGLVIGLTVEERLPGVDPFNITMYLWALAAVVLLVCKARMVQEWSWNDFLHGRVQCRSVSELRAVTGINDQLIIARLLHDEKDSLLQTRGPFNAVFRNKADSGGFSIDVPIRNKTLLLSGLIMIKVRGPLGHDLVCLDVRRGTEVNMVSYHEEMRSKERLMCQRIDRLAQAASSRPSTKPRFPLKLGKPDWRLVEGVYNVLEAEFI